MKRRLLLLLTLIVIAAFALAACGGQPAAEEPAVEEPAAEEPAEEPAAEEPAEEPEEPMGEDLGLSAPLDGMSWEEIVAAADGTEVNWWMWGGSDTINAFVNEYMANELKDQYNITLNQVPVAGPTEFINQVLGEKDAGVDDAGAVDIMWINGENFRTMKEADLLYGPFSEVVPSGFNYDWTDASIANDFGYPVEGYEIPWSGAQVVLEYDTEKVEPLADMGALVEWVKENPGLFTYPAPPDFTGSVWVRMMCYYATGGFEQFLGPFDQELFDEKFPACWDLLNELEPFLWREGETYPEGQPANIDMFANGEVLYRMTYGPGDAQTRIDNGTYPESVRTFVLDDGTIANTNYIAVAYNAANLPAAVVTANFIADPETQYQRVVQLNSLVPVDVTTLDADMAAKYASIELGPAVLGLDVLGPHKLPELSSDWLVAIENGWIENVLQK